MKDRKEKVTSREAFKEARKAIHLSSAFYPHWTSQISRQERTEFFITPQSLSGHCTHCFIPQILLEWARVDSLAMQSISALNLQTKPFSLEGEKRRERESFCSCFISFVDSTLLSRDSSTHIKRARMCRSLGQVDKATEEDNTQSPGREAVRQIKC